ncbi:ABC transporter permease [uncultured Cohaesibacter sp.]|uniref:ABC transporter permease n=1 Tax=uncultured Cohaesibacter sp. TaxID=1002546 RepID=UPI0029C652B6|nr:ABC transporter permease [uncultured Cohaesibacter sp.]
MKPDEINGSGTQRELAAPLKATRRGRRVGPLVARRLLFIPLALFGVITISFLLVSLMPGDPALSILGTTASAQEVADLRSKLGLDLPMPSRYGTYVLQVLSGDLGNSFFTGQPILGEIVKYMPASIELVVMALIVAFFLGVPLGAIAAYYRGRGADRVVRTGMAGLQAVPEFLAGLLLIFFFFYLLKLAPAPTGRLGIIDLPPPSRTGFLLVDSILAGNWKILGTALQRSFLPVATLALTAIPMFAKVTRTTTSAALASKQVAFARACGLPEWRVLYYALLQARTAVLTYTAMLFGAMVGGSAIVETLFSWQGLGQWGLDAIIKLDIPAIQGFVIAMGLFTLLVYLVLDLVVVMLDPRIKND